MKLTRLGSLAERSLIFFITLVIASLLTPKIDAKADDAVQYLPSKNCWILQGSSSQYAIQAKKTGELLHLWWGPKLDISDYQSGVVSPVQNRSGWGENGQYLEYPGWGEWRYAEPGLKASFPDGVRHLQLRFQSHKIDGNRLIITLKDTHYPFVVELHYRVLPEYDLLERHAIIRNTGDQPIDIDQALSAVWHLPRIQAWDMHYLSGKWGAETQMRKVPLSQGKFQIESRHGATSHELNPWFAVTASQAASENQGEAWFGSLAWSGSWKIASEINAAGRLQISGGIHDFDFKWRLKPGDKLETPMFVGGYSKNGLGSAARQMHRYQLNEILPKESARTLRPIIYNSWYATTFNINVEQQINLAKKAKDLGVELFVIDDGWFGKRDNDRAGLGDWFPSPTKFPQGLTPLISAVHQLGMKFGVWVEPEMVNPDSDLYRAHPDWVFSFPNRPRTEQRNQLILNFAIPEVKEHLFKMLDKLLSENPIDFIKWDMNRHIMEPGWMAAPLEHQKEMWVRHALAVYDILDRLRAKYPNVLWESCSGGGGRADMGILRRTDQIWTSDNTDPIDRLFIQEGFYHAFAPKVQVAWVTDVPEGINHRTTSLSFRYHSAMMGTVGVGGNLLKWVPEEFEQTKWFLAEYKQIRPLVQEGDFYQLQSPRFASTYPGPGGLLDNGFWAFEFAAPDQSSAVLFAFLRSSHVLSDLPSIRLMGLDPKAQYRVEARQPDKANLAINTQIMSGSALMERGLSLRLRGDYVSALIRISRTSN